MVQFIFANIRYYKDEVASCKLRILQLQKLMSWRIFALQYLDSVLDFSNANFSYLWPKNHVTEIA